MQTVDPYFHGEGIDGTQFEKVSDNVYTYRWNWYRNLIINTNEGLVIIDPINPEMSAALKRELDSQFPNRKVQTLICSHYHLTHTQGGSVLMPENVIAHEKSEFYWVAVDSTGVLEPTRHISGDATLNIRGMKFGLYITDFRIPTLCMGFIFHQLNSFLALM